MLFWQDLQKETIFVTPYLLSVKDLFQIKLTFVISNTDISKSLLISKNTFTMHLPFFFTFQLRIYLKLLVSLSKFSDTRKFTLRYQAFEMNFDFETVGNECNLLIEKHLIPLKKDAPTPMKWETYSS